MKTTCPDRRRHDRPVDDLANRCFASASAARDVAASAEAASSKLGDLGVPEHRGRHVWRWSTRAIWRQPRHGSGISKQSGTTPRQVYGSPVPPPIGTPWTRRLTGPLRDFVPARRTPPGARLRLPIS